MPQRQIKTPMNQINASASSYRIRTGKTQLYKVEFCSVPSTDTTKWEDTPEVGRYSIKSLFFAKMRCDFVPENLAF